MLILGISGSEIDFDRRVDDVIAALIGTASAIHLVVDGRPPPVDYPSHRT